MPIIRKTKKTLKFIKPAEWWGSTWREAIPTGNGVLGAAVNGGAGSETIMLNHSDLWWQGGMGVLPDVTDKLSSVRKKLDENSPLEAQDILADALITKGYRPRKAYPLPLCDLCIEMPVSKSIKEYQRVLDLESGEITVSYKDGATKFKRQCFVSRVNGLFCMELTKSGQKTIEAEFSIKMHDKFNARTKVSISKLPEGVNSRYENFFMYYSARSDNGSEYGAVARITHYGGTQSIDPQKGITIKGAERITLILQPFIESQREKEWRNLKISLTGVKLTYEKMLKEHTAIHSKLFGSAELKLGNADKDVPIEKLLDSVRENGELPPALAEKLWAYGRHLFICGVSTVGKLYTPYGIWCGEYKAENSGLNMAGQLQLCYNHALAGNLGEYCFNIYKYFSSVTDDLKKNSSRLYACRGILIPITMIYGTGLLGSSDPEVVHFTAAAGWVSNLLFDYSLFESDEKALKESIMPFMRETALFYEEFLRLKNGKYDSAPSYSPYTTPGNCTIPEQELKICKNATIDFAVVKQLLKNLISGSERTGLYSDEVSKWQNMLTCIPSYSYNSDGTIKEYCDKNYTDNAKSPSSVACYAAYPGTEAEEKAELSKAIRTTAIKKLTTARKYMTAEDMSKFAGILARTGDGKQAYDVIEELVRSMCMKNLVFANSDWRGTGVGKVDIWADYTTVPNLIITDAIQEMLVNSTDSTVSLLPALPETLESGELNGILTRVGAEVCISWNRKRGTATVKIKSRKSKTISVKLPQTATYKPSKNGETFDSITKVINNLELAAGKIVQFSFKFK